MKPLSRRNGIFIENLPEEVVVYDKTRDQVHCLNKMAATIWGSADGTRTVDDLARIVEEQTGASGDRDLVLEALEELEKAGLMEAGSDLASSTDLPSRREAVGQIALAGSALVATIAAAAPAAHASIQTLPSDPPRLPISSNPPDPPPTGPMPTGPTPPTGFKPIGPTPPTGYTPTGPTPPTGYKPTVPTPPTGYKPTVPTPPTGYKPTVPTPPTGYEPTGPTSPGTLLGGNKKP